MKIEKFDTAEELKIYLEDNTKNQKKFWLPMVEVVHALSACDSSSLIIEVKEYLDFLRSLEPSSRTHYIQLNEWSKPVYNHIYRMIEKHEAVEDKEEAAKSIDVKVWLSIWDLTNDIIWSPKLYTNVSNHHSSALSRNNALITELEDVLSLIQRLDGVKCH